MESECGQYRHGLKSRQEPCDVPCTPRDCCSGPVLPESGCAVLDIIHVLWKLLVEVHLRAPRARWVSEAAVL